MLLTRSQLCEPTPSTVHGVLQEGQAQCAGGSPDKEQRAQAARARYGVGLEASHASRRCSPAPSGQGCHRHRWAVTPCHASTAYLACTASHSSAMAAVCNSQMSQSAGPCSICMLQHQMPVRVHSFVPNLGGLCGKPCCICSSTLWQAPLHALHCNAIN